MDFSYSNRIVLMVIVMILPLGLHIQYLKQRYAR